LPALRREAHRRVTPTSGSLAALKPFLGDENLGSFARNFGRSAAWRAGDEVDPPDVAGPDLSHARAAVLIGPRTASAGEAVTIAFRGRPNTRSFGAATAGLTNGNGTFPLPDGSTIVLASVEELDRNDRAYTGKIEPDVAVAASSTDGNDPVEIAAAAWLNQTCGQ
jgi:C-terminal processing protease CtpA/Prc